MASLPYASQASSRQARQGRGRSSHRIARDSTRRCDRLAAVCDARGNEKFARSEDGRVSGRMGFRDEFPVLESIAYLNAGTDGPLPRAAAELAQAELAAEAGEGRLYTHFMRRHELQD